MSRSYGEIKMLSFCRKMSDRELKVMNQHPSLPDNFMTLDSAPFRISWCQKPPSGPKWGRKIGAARRLSKSVKNKFDHFGFFALREKCLKVSENMFDTFWRFLTWPLSAGPFKLMSTNFLKCNFVQLIATCLPCISSWSWTSFKHNLCNVMLMQFIWNYFDNNVCNVIRDLKLKAN